jgi:glyoxylate utilization-related uncharacterized protein
VANTYIDSNKIPHTKVSGSGEFAEILNDHLAGAKNVIARLHWLDRGHEIEASPDAKTHQLIYLLEGEGTIALNDQDHKVTKGAGIYLGPSESARISQSGNATLKLFYLVVPKQG